MRNNLGKQIGLIREHRKHLVTQKYITCDKKQHSQTIIIHNWTDPRRYDEHLLNPDNESMEKGELKDNSQSYGQSLDESYGQSLDESYGQSLDESYGQSIPQQGEISVPSYSHISNNHRTQNNIKSIPQAVTQEPIREPCDPDGITESMELGYGGIRKKDVRYSHAAYRAFYEVTNRKPNKSIIDTLIEILGDNPDVPKLKSCFIEWIARGYNPQSYKWVDWYADGIPGRKPNEIKAFRPTAPDDEFYDAINR